MIELIIYYVSNFLYEIITFRLHAILQLLLAIILIWIIFKKSEKKVKSISKEEEEVIIRNYQPKPLVNAVANVRPRIVDGKIQKHVIVNGIKCLNLATCDFHSLLGNKKCEEETIKTIRKYGIGTCGPRGFYGTIDVHLNFEDAVAKFLGVEEVIVYSYGFSCISSAIPAYAKRTDVVFVDENVNFPIQKGLQASRSEIKYFKHNNVDHLNQLLCEQEQLDRINPQKAKKTKRFLIVEGIYGKSGDLCKLPELMELKKKFKVRLFIDESLSFGVLGEHGRGIVEHFGMHMADVDLILVSMEYTLASNGGFCAGTEFVIKHQRLSSIGYCFSAALPPISTVGAMANLHIIQENPIFVKQLNDICETAQKLLKQNETIMNYFSLISDTYSPIKHLVPINLEKSDEFLDFLVEYCEYNNVAICKAVYLAEDKPPCLPSIKLAISRALTSSDIEQALAVIEKALKLE